MVLIRKKMAIWSNYFRLKEYLGRHYLISVIKNILAVVVKLNNINFFVMKFFLNISFTHSYGSKDPKYVC